MFLQRKFPCDAALSSPEFAALPERVRDVIANLNLLLATRRGVGHILPDFGFTRSGHWSVEGTFAEYSTEFRENVVRYEPHLELLDIDAESGEGDRSEIEIQACIDGIEGVWTLIVDLRIGGVARVTRGD